MIQRDRRVLLSPFKLNLLLRIGIFFAVTSIQVINSLTFSGLPTSITFSESITSGPATIVACSSNIEIVAAYGNAGIGLLSKDGESKALIDLKESVEVITADTKGKILFAALKDRIVMYSIDASNLTISLLSEVSFPDYHIVKLILEGQNDILFAITNEGEILIMETSGLTELKILLHAYPYGQSPSVWLSITTAQLSEEESFLFLGLDDRMDIWKVNYDNIITGDQQSPLTLASSLESDYAVTQIQHGSSYGENWVYYSNNFSGVFIANVDALYTSTVLFPVSITTSYFGVGTANVSPTVYALGLSTQSDMLLVGIRSEGFLLFIFQESYGSPIFQQQNYSDGMSIQFLVSSGFFIPLLYFSNSNGLFLYTGLTDNGDGVPQLFNTHKSRTFGVEFGTAPNKFSCQIQDYGRGFYGAFGSNRLQKLAIQWHDYFMFNVKYEETLPRATDGFSENQTIKSVLFISDSRMILSIKNSIYAGAQYDYDETNGWELVRKLEFTINRDAETITLSKSQKTILFTYSSGIALVDVVTFKIISFLKIQALKQQGSSGDFTFKENYVIITARNIGLWLIDISDLKNPIIVNTLLTGGAESIQRSKNTDIAFLADGFNGMVILDTSKLPAFVYVSNFKTPGWTNYLNIFELEDFVLISTMDKGMLTLINILDQSNPFVLGRFSVGSEHAYSSCLSSDQNSVYILTPTTIRYVALQSRIVIRNELRIVHNATDSTKDELIELNIHATVGQLHSIRFSPIYPKPRGVQSQLFLYMNEVLIELPDWVEQVKTQEFRFTPPKELINSVNELRSVLQFVTRTSFSIDKNTFIFPTDTTSYFPNYGIIISSNLSEKIFNYLKANQIIDSNNYLSSSYNPEFKIGFDDFADESPVPDDETKQTIVTLAQAFLSDSIDFNLITIPIRSSLVFYPNPENGIYIQSVGTNVQITFSFALDSANRFVQKSYPGSLTYRNEQDTSITFQGTIDFVNSILNNTLLIYSGITNDENVIQYCETNCLVSISINDYVNLPLNLTYTLINETIATASTTESTSTPILKFFSNKRPIVLKNDLMETVNRQYENQDLDIESQFIIQFEQDTFVDVDGIELTYDLLIKSTSSDGEYRVIAADSFIKFDSTYLRVSGTAPAKYFYERFYLRLRASNGYTSVSADFNFSFNSVGFAYMVNFFLKIVGPLACLLGLYRQRSYFVNLVYQNKTFYSHETIPVNVPYCKKITLIGDDFLLAKLFFMRFIEQMKSINSNSCSLQDDIFGELAKINSLQEDPKTKIFLGKVMTQSLVNMSQTNLNNNINSKADSPSGSLNQMGKLSNNQVKNSTQPLQQQQQQQQQNTKSLYAKQQTTPSGTLGGNWSQQAQLGRSVKAPSYQLTNNQGQNVFNIDKSAADLFSSKAMLGTSSQWRSRLSKENLMHHQNKKNLRSKLITVANPEKKSMILSARKQIVNSMLNSSSSSSTPSDDNSSSRREKVAAVLRQICVSADKKNIETEKLFLIMCSMKLSINFRGRDYRIEDFTATRVDPALRFHMSLRACCARYLLKHDRKTNLTYKFVREYSQKFPEPPLLANDWYKAFVVVDTTETQGIYEGTSFSSISFIPEEFMKIFNLMKVEVDSFEHLQQVLQIDPLLLREVILADSLGLDDSSKGAMSYCRGESLHLMQRDIHSVEAYKIINNGQMMCLRRCLNIEYERIPITKYLSLPSWLQLDCKQGVILLHGTPTQMDVDELLIRIFNPNGFVVLQFSLSIQETLDNERFNEQQQQQKNNDEEEQLLKHSPNHTMPLGGIRGGVNHLRGEQNIDDSTNQMVTNHQNISMNRSALLLSQVGLTQSENPQMERKHNNNKSKQLVVVEMTEHYRKEEQFQQQQPTDRMSQLDEHNDHPSVRVSDDSEIFSMMPKKQKAKKQLVQIGESHENRTIEMIKAKQGENSVLQQQPQLLQFDLIERYNLTDDEKSNTSITKGSVGKMQFGSDTVSAIHELDIDDPPFIELRVESHSIPTVTNPTLFTQKDKS